VGNCNGAQTAISSNGETITDPQGRPVPLAKVAGTCFETIAKRRVQSTKIGGYVLD
jgi:hypothetical protein